MSNEKSGQNPPGGGLSRLREALRKRTRTRVKIVYELDVDTALPPAEGDPFHLEPATPGLIKKLHSTYPREINERKRDILLARIQDPGEDCWVIVDQEGNLSGFAGAAWTDHLIRKENHVVKVHEHQMLLMDDYVVKSHRRRGAHSFSIPARLRAGAERGRTEARVVIDRTNEASKTVYLRAGARPVGRIITFMHWRRSVQFQRPSPRRNSGGQRRAG